MLQSTWLREGRRTGMQIVLVFFILCKLLFCSTVLQELERTLALLAFDDPASCPFADLLAPAHRQQVASKLNAAILMTEHADSTQSKLAVSLKMLLWAQDELDKKRVRYPHMQLSTGQIEEPK
jgi:hypothetical protein